MAKGTIVKNEFYTYTDSFTGVNVTRLTNPKTLNHHQYFYNKMISNDGRWLLYSRADENNIRNIFKMDLNSGEAIQLTEGTGTGEYSAEFSSDDKYIFYDKNNKLIKMNTATLEEEVYYEVPEGWNLGGTGKSSDDRYMAITCMAEKDRIHNNNGWSTFKPQWEAKPLCRIIYIDIENKTSHTVLEQKCWLGHPQIRPHDNSTIMFCHEGPQSCIDARLWLINSDGTNERRVREHPQDIIITHEFWTPDGSKLGYVFRGKNIPETIRLANPITLEETILMQCSKCAHFIVDQTCTYGVGDAQQKPFEAADAALDNGAPSNNFICLMDLKNKTEKKLCFHGTSWKDNYGNSQDTHPHPAFSPDGRFIVFTSDKDGMPAIYKVNIK